MLIKFAEMIDSKTINQIIRFGVVGVTAAATHFCVALMLTEYVGVAIQISNLIGFWLGFILSYAGQVLFTFKAKLSRDNFLSYLGLGLINYCIACAIIFIGDFWLPNWAVLGGTVVLIPLFSFLVSKLWIFR